MSRFLSLPAVACLCAGALASGIDRPHPFPAYYPSAADCSRAETALQAAAQALAAGNLDEAERQAREAARAVPTSSAPVVLLALTAEQRGTIPEAVDLYREALAWDPGEPRALAALERLGAPRFVDEVGQHEWELFGYINEARVANGLPPVKPHAELSDVARAYSASMRDRGFFDHTSPVPGETHTLDRFLKRFDGIPRSLGENISRRWTRPAPALSTPNIAASHAELMLSTGHRRNILKPEAVYCGVGIATNEFGDYWITELFMAPRPDRNSRMIIQSPH